MNYFNTMETPEFLSPKKYAAIVGCDIVIIDRAIRAGKIPPECVTINPGNGYKSINVAMAEQAWGIAYRENRRQQNRAVLRKQEEKPVPVKQVIAPVLEEGSMPELGAKTTYNEADRQKKIYEAKLLQLKLEEETGGLVRLETIKKVFFDQAHIVRDNFISLSDRIIDQVFSAENRNAAQVILQKEINIILESLNKIPDHRHA